MPIDETKVHEMLKNRPTYKSKIQGEINNYES
jgi:hypothetical protein